MDKKPIEGWSYMEKGITKLKRILEGDPSEESFDAEFYMMLYTMIYNMCTQKPPHDYSEQLYSRYRDAFNIYINETVLPSLRDLRDETLLRELHKRWQNHNIMIRWLSRFFNYLADGEVMESAIWAPRNPGNPVNYNVNWTYGGDGSRNGPAGYAAIHGCENDTVTFFVQGGQHNLVEIATYGQAPCNMINAIPAMPPQNSPYTFFLPFTNRWGFFDYADSLGNNCVAGSMHIQIIFHRPPTPKYGCYSQGAVVSGIPVYPPAPSSIKSSASLIQLDSATASVSAADRHAVSVQGWTRFGQSLGSWFKG